MAVLNDNFTLRVPAPFDDRAGHWDGAAWQPFASRQDALDKTVYYRYRTLTLPVMEAGDVVEYWFKTGIQDADFVLKTSQADLSNYYTKTELQTAGQSQVHWDNLTNVPSFATDWGSITGDQSVVGNAGFSNTANYITLNDLPPVTTPTLQQVTTAGNTTTDSIVLPRTHVNTILGDVDSPSVPTVNNLTSPILSPITFVAVNDSAYIGIYGPSRNQSALGISKNGSTISIGNTDSSTIDGIRLLSLNKSIVFQAKEFRFQQSLTVNSGLLSFSGLTDDRTYQYPDKSGTVALLDDIPDLTGYATEQWVIDQGYITAVTSSWDVNTGNLVIQGNTSNLDGRYMLRSNTITSGYGITASGDFTNPVAIEVDTGVLDNRYIRKDTNDSNGTNSLILGPVNTNNLTVTAQMTLGSVGAGVITDELVVRDPSTFRIRLMPMPDFGGSFTVANEAGVTQFTVNSGETIRFADNADAVVTFNATTKTVTYSAVGGGGGTGIQSVFGRPGPNVIAESGDYTTTLVDEGTNLYFTESRVLNTGIINGYSPNNSLILPEDNIIQAISKAQGQILARVPTSRTVAINGAAGNISVSGTPIQSLDNDVSWTINLATVGTAGSNKTKVTTDQYGRVINSAALLMSDLPSAVTQTLSTELTSGQISISDGNQVSVLSLGPVGRPDPTNRYFSSTFNFYTTIAGNTGYPTTSVGTGFRLERYSGPTSQLGMDFYTNGQNSGIEPLVWYKIFSSTSTEGDWKAIASRDWVITQIPTNYVTTDTIQTVTANKTWTGTHRFDSSVYMGAPNGAIQRHDARDDGTGEARIHRYGLSSTNVTVAYKDRWYNGSSYINVDTTTNGVSFGGLITSNTPTGFLNIGSQNTSYAHYNTDRPAHFFYKDVEVQGQLKVDNGGNTAYTSPGSVALKNSASSPFISFHTSVGARIGYIQASSAILVINSEGTPTRISSIAGTGTQMVTVNATGDLGRAPIPSGGGGVASITAGQHLTGGVITTNGTIGLAPEINAYVNDSQGNPRLYFEGSATSSSGVILRASNPAHTFQFRNSANVNIWNVNNTGTLTVGTVPYARTTGVAPSVHNHTWSQLSGGSTALIPGAGASGAYGSLSISGSKGAYAGIQFTSVSSGATFMVRTTDSYSGLYNITGGSWYWAWDGTGTLASGTVPVARVGFVGTTAQYIRGDGSLATYANTTYSNGNGLTLFGTTFSLTPINAGSAVIGAVRYNGNTRTAGSWYGGTVAPANATRLNFDGIIHAYDFVSYGVSDLRMKENVEVISNPLEKLKEISGYSFDWKKGHASYYGSDYGIIAQEVEKVLPNMVFTREDGFKGVKKENQLTALLIEAVKQLSREVEALRNGVS